MRRKARARKRPLSPSGLRKRWEALVSRRGECLEMLAPRELHPHPLIAHKRIASSHMAHVVGACRVAPLIGTVIAEEDNSIVGGLAYYRAAKRLRLAKVPVVRVAQLTAREKYRYECELAGEPTSLFPGPRG